MRLMKGLGFFSLLNLMLISILSMVSQVNALPTDYSNLEDLLTLAKEKLEQIKPDYTYSNITLDQFANHLTNITLNQEQIKEVEAEHDSQTMNIVWVSS